jgi:hypothetical protein
MTQTTAQIELTDDPTVTIYEAAIAFDKAFPEALRGGHWGSAASATLQALSQVSPQALLCLAAAVASTPEDAWLTPQWRDEAMALAEFLACRLAAMGQN